MTYMVKEIFYTLQGEGTHAGRPAVFCRFTSCNLWTGQEKDRARAICQFCDTDFVGTNGPGGGRFATAQELASAVACRVARCGPRAGAPLRCLHRRRATSATRPGRRRGPACGGVRGSCRDQRHSGRSRGTGLGLRQPKSRRTAKLTSGDELKLVFPQEGAAPELFEELNFSRLQLQPMDGPEREKNTRLAVEYCLAHPQWQLSLQTHKYLGIP